MCEGFEEIPETIINENIETGRSKDDKRLRYILSRLLSVVCLNYFFFEKNLERSDHSENVYMKFV